MEYNLNVVYLLFIFYMANSAADWYFFLMRDNAVCVQLDWNMVQMKRVNIFIL
jgi:hypothetical protein